MKKKKINQIVFYFYAVSFCILLIVLMFFTMYFSKQDKKEQLQSLESSVHSTQGQIVSTINTMEYMHRLLYPNALRMLADKSENDKSLMLNNIFICRDLNNEHFYSMLFYPDESYKIITNDIDDFIISNICRIYKQSDKTKKYTYFFIQKEDNANTIYIYNSQPVLYSSTSDIECNTLGTSVLITKINIPEYYRYFSYPPSVGISLKSAAGSDEIAISKISSSAKIISEYDCNVDGTGWKVCGSMAYNINLFERQTLFKLFIVQTFLIILSLTLLFQIIYKKYIMKPINQISDFLSEYIILNKTVEILPQTSYEFDKIAKYISQMANKNRELIRQIFNNQQTIYEKEIESNAYKFYALKAQINPHFLYNTLDCISSTAYINDIKPLAHITNMLSKILRYTITDKTYTTVKDEVDLLNNYFGIMKIRYRDRFNYRINADENLSDCKVPHMLLQPIAENSVKHNNLAASKLIIYVKIYASDGFLNFIIMDNGIGMSAEKMNALNAALAEAVSASTHTAPKSSHIGIHNINSRIKLIYGNEYGIRLSGTENKYIKISVKIPIEKSE